MDILNHLDYMLADQIYRIIAFGIFALFSGAQAIRNKRMFGLGMFALFASYAYRISSNVIFDDPPASNLIITNAVQTFTIFTIAYDLFYDLRSNLARR